MTLDPFLGNANCVSGAESSAVAIASAVQQRAISAQEVVAASLDRIQQRDGDFNAFTEVLKDSALEAAERLDQQVAQGIPVGPLAGVPFAVKNLFDVAGLTTLAGSKINREHPPAQADATVVARLKQAGAILVGTLNMDEYAYGFVTENSHYGPTHNPHDLQRIAGGSSGGSAAAVAGGLVPLSLGSDTNGSIRVPASLCGIYGLKPTYGRLSRAGVALFAGSFDHVGPFARSVADIALSFDVMQGPDPSDPVCSQRPPDPTFGQLGQGIEGLRIAVAEDYFARGAEPQILAGVEKLAQALGVTRTVRIPEAHRARAAAYLITAAEGANLHLHNLKTRPQDFDPATRDRFLAGALLPADWILQAQRFRSWYRQQVLMVFQEIDLFITPTTPCPAPLIGQEKMVIDGVEVLTRPNLGLYTQPLSFIGLPVLSVPLRETGSLPFGVQLVAAPYQEAKLLRVAAHLESLGIPNAQPV
ncbi:AtzE family amidohydrolase [Thermostichus vulcanus]|uniref:AtzE family amidohydrolase n=1 Tax=Thermostichus vulcanus str. 'Rupite' TaxID=2813851 RepID=A0ABT0CBP9_THEVL|nr:AtzE family amidohydrolase [Thermostichus vulcanus]MCJ2543211.1 AtzE family amidohydrolase [Thermostichus vulcanus str. 'Rupite']